MFCNWKVNLLLSWLQITNKFMNAAHMLCLSPVLELLVISSRVQQLLLFIFEYNYSKFSITYHLKI